MELGKRKPPKPQTCGAWKKKHQSFVFDENDLMHCKLYVKWETKIASCDNFSLSFINGSGNYHLSNVESHHKYMMHLTAVEKEEQEQVEKLRGNYKTEKKITVPNDPMIRRSIENMSSIGEDEQDTLKRLIEVSNYLAVNECPYTDFHGLVDLEKMHRVKFLKGKSYENETTHRDFIQNAAECLLQEDLEKLKQANFICSF